MIPMQFSNRGAPSHIPITTVPSATSLVQRSCPVSQANRYKEFEIGLKFPRSTRPPIPSSLMKQRDPTARSSYELMSYDHVHLQTLCLKRGLSIILRGMERRGLLQNVPQHVFRKSSKQVPRPVIDMTSCIQTRLSSHHGNAARCSHYSLSRRQIQIEQLVSNKLPVRGGCGGAYSQDIERSSPI